LPGAHYRDSIGNIGDHTEVVGDKYQADVALFFQLVEQV